MNALTSNFLADDREKYSSKINKALEVYSDSFSPPINLKSLFVLLSL